jgi:hypothetical protein
MSQAPASDDDLPLSRRAGAVLGVAIALLLAMLPGIGVQGAKAPASIGAAHGERPLLTAAHRLNEARAALDKARPDLGSPPVLPAAALAFVFLLLGGATLRPHFTRAQLPARWPSTARARAPPHA